MKVFVVGASRGSGRAAVEELLSAGHDVTAFSRHASQLGIRSDRLKILDGDAMSATDAERAVQGQDAVIVTLGISENALRVRLFGSPVTPINVRSAGTRNVISAMRKHGVRKLVVQSSYGVGETRNRLRPWERLFFWSMLKEQVADTEEQEREVRASGLDWVLVQPVHLTDGPEKGGLFASPEGDVRRLSISRKNVARFLIDAAHGTTYVGKSVALSTS
jgi:nucleoside-diphosphate-sugar epimerase